MIPVSKDVASGLPPVTLILGGARSGKSLYAERLVEGAACAGTYCATAEAGDREMAQRIAAHRARRGRFWRTVEEPLAVASVIADEATAERPLLVDCLTLWTSNCLWPPAPAGRSVDAQPDLSGWRAECEEFLATLRASSNDVIIVSNEVGTGIVPESAAARVFRDEHGRLNQAVAAVCEEVFLVTAGLPLRLK